MTSFLVSITVKNSAGLTATGTATIDTSADGAPTGPAQYPALLAGYPVRPPWRVAGVDYRVGINTGVVLKNAGTAALPAGVSRSGSMILVTGNNITFDGWDFGVNGGWYVEVRGSNTRFVNCNFLVGSQMNQPIVTTQSANNLYVGYCVVDGAARDINGMIEMRGGGNLTVEYCWLKNAGTDMIQMHSDGNDVVIRNNLIDNGGMAAGAHGDYTEFIAGDRNGFNVTIQYNTTRQTGGTTQGFMCEPDFGSQSHCVKSGDVGWNTFTGAPNAFTAVTITSIIGAYKVHDNYFDPSRSIAGLAIGGIRGGPGDGSAKTIYSNNRNMTNGYLEEND